MINGFIQVDGASLYFQSEGDERGPCVVFCNSLATNLTMWDAQAQLLAHDYRVVRYDQRGHGRSTVEERPFGFDELSGDLLAVMDHLDVCMAVLVGVSMGAVTVLNFAARFPARTVKVIACDGQWKSPAGAGQAWSARIRQAREEGMASLVASTLQRWFPETFLASGVDEISKICRGITQTSVPGYALCAGALQSYDLSEPIAGIAVPCALVVGQCDGQLPVVMRQMHEAILHSRFHEIAGAGHLPGVDQPASFNQVLQQELKVLA